MKNVTADQRDFQALKKQLELHRSAGVVGVDVAKNKHFAMILDPAGQRIVRWAFFMTSRLTQSTVN